MRTVSSPPPVRAYRSYFFAFYLWHELQARASMRYVRLNLMSSVLYLGSNILHLIIRKRLCVVADKPEFRVAPDHDRRWTDHPEAYIE